VKRLLHLTTRIFLCFILVGCMTRAREAPGHSPNFVSSPGVIAVGEGSIFTPRGTVQFEAEKGLQVQIVNFEGKDRPDVVFLRDGKDGRDVIVAFASSQWQKVMQVKLADAPRNIQVFDWDGDGRPEIVYGIPRTAQVRFVRARIGQQKTESATLRFSQEDYSKTEAMAGFHAEINRDGIEDYGFWYGENHEMVIFLSRGAKNDPHIVRQPIGETPQVNVTAVGDINNDRRKELVMGFGPGTPDGVGMISFVGNILDKNSMFAVKINTESPTTRVELETEAPSAELSRYLDLGVQGVAIGDVNEDGLFDFITANGFAGTISVAINRGHYQFSVQSFTIDYPKGERIPSVLAVALADADGDGRLDIHLLVTVQESPGDRFLDAIVIAKGDGKGGFLGSEYLELGSPASCMAVADIDGNGVPDYALAGSPLQIIFR